jgi:hypothetical protein
MFKLIKKLFKGVVYGTAGLISLIVLVTVLSPQTDAERLERQAKREAAAAAEKIIAEQKAEEKRIAELQKKQAEKQAKIDEWVKADERKKLHLTIDADGFTSINLCREMARKGSKFPSKIDFDWGVDKSRTWWTDGTDVNRGKYTVKLSGEAMNGFGMMLPFSVECNYAVNIRGKSLHPTTVKWISGGSVNTLLDLPAPDINNYKGKVFDPKA